MLKIEHYCDVYDLMKEISQKTGKNSSTIALELDRVGLFPVDDEGDDKPVFISFRNGKQCCPSIPWLNDAIYDIFCEAGIESISLIDNG